MPQEDELAFWAEIDQTRTAARGDVDRQTEELTRRLIGRSKAEIESLARTYNAYHARACRWNLWAAGYAIDGGMSDDAFSDFRDWLIGRGQDVYERALAKPDDLADLPEAQEGNVRGSLVNAFYDAYYDTHGDELPYHVVAGDPVEPLGESWDDDELGRIVPRLHRR